MDSSAISEAADVLGGGRRVKASANEVVPAGARP
jgi:hypothetical protein